MPGASAKYDPKKVGVSLLHAELIEMWIFPTAPRLNCRYRSRKIRSRAFAKLED